MPRKPTRATQLGVDNAEYQRLLEAQGGHCALCPNVPKTRKLHSDHDHHSPEHRVRGLLCHRCNRNLPSWVTPEWLREAADYIEAGGYQRIRALRLLPADLPRIPRVDRYSKEAP